MSFDKDRAFDFLRSIAFERISGSPAEDKAVRLICEAVKKAGVVPKVETFRIRALTKGAASVEILAPYRKKYPAKPVAFSGSFPKGGKVLPLQFVATTHVAALRNVKGKAIFGHRLSGTANLEKMKGHGLAALIEISDFGRGITYGLLPGKAPKQWRRTPIVIIPFEAGMEMAVKGASRARIKVEQSERMGRSKNIIAVVKGIGRESAEEILICAHHDSRADSPGSSDNGGGVATILTLLEHFARNPARRSLRFAWFGGEEQGMVGSRAYAKAHRREMGNVKLVVNVDGAGRLLSSSYAVVHGTDDLRRFVADIAGKRGLNFRTVEESFRSDNLAFAQHGIPAINITRGGYANLFAHTRNDDIKWSAPEGLLPGGEMALEIIRRLGDAPRLPFKRGFNKHVRGILKLLSVNNKRLARGKTPQGPAAPGLGRRPGRKQ